MVVLGLLRLLPGREQVRSQLANYGTAASPGMTARGAAVTAPMAIAKAPNKLTGQISQTPRTKTVCALRLPTTTRELA